MATRPLDKRITFETREVVKSTRSGTVSSEEWSDVCTVWASVWEMLPGQAERIEGNIDIGTRRWDIEVRHGVPVTADMRVIYGGQTMKIVSGPAPKGRKDRLVLRCEEYSTEGVEP